jgi:hypothetical protein
MELAPLTRGIGVAEVGSRLNIRHFKLVLALTSTYAIRSTTLPNDTLVLDGRAVRWLKCQMFRRDPKDPPQYNIQAVNRCISRPDTLPGTAQTHLGPQGIILFFTTPGRVPLTNPDSNIASILDLHYRRYRESKIMWKKMFSNILLALCFFSPAGCCLARELLFQAEPANCDDYEGPSRKLCELYRTEFDPRMFPHRTWHQRLAYSSGEQDVDETLEIYSKPDGSRWLSHRRANPSLSEIIGRRDIYGAKFDWKKEVGKVRITAHDIALPVEVANELDQLWRTMLPGVPYEKVPLILTTHTPIFDAWVHKDNSVAEAGRIPMAAYATPIYRAFVDVIKDLREVCDRGGNSTDPILKRLPDKVRHLRGQLEKL